MDQHRFKTDLKRLYHFCVSAIKRKDAKYINFLLLQLNNKNTELKALHISDFSLYLLKKEIKMMQKLLRNNLK